MILYCPPPSVTTERVFSIKAGLEASTVTPGSSAPEESLTTPAIDPCACASVERRRTTATTSDPSQSGFMLPPAEVARGSRINTDVTSLCAGRYHGMQGPARGKYSSAKRQRWV